MMSSMSGLTVGQELTINGSTYTVSDSKMLGKLPVRVVFSAVGGEYCLTTGLERVPNALWHAVGVADILGSSIGSEQLKFGAATFELRATGPDWHYYQAGGDHLLLFKNGNWKGKRGTPITSIG